MSTARQYGKRVLETLDESVLLKVGIFGVLLIVLAYFLSPGVVSGLMPIYGLIFVVFGFGGYLLFWVIKRM